MNYICLDFRPGHKSYWNDIKGRSIEENALGTYKQNKKLMRLIENDDGKPDSSKTSKLFYAGRKDGRHFLRPFVFTEGEKVPIEDFYDTDRPESIFFERVFGIRERLDNFDPDPFAVECNNNGCPGKPEYIVLGVRGMRYDDAAIVSASYSCGKHGNQIMDLPARSVIDFEDMMYKFPLKPSEIKENLLINIRKSGADTIFQGILKAAGYKGQLEKIERRKLARLFFEKLKLRRFEQLKLFDNL
jgi:hypothetical protein